MVCFKTEESRENEIEPIGDLIPKGKCSFLRITVDSNLKWKEHKNHGCSIK